MKVKATIAVVIATIFISACSQASPVPVTTTPTLRPTATPPPPTSTPAPSSTATESPTSTPEGGFILPLPQGTPADTWQGIRIMPGAVAGEELQSGGYAFTTLASNDSIEQFYVNEMQAHGWEYIATGSSEKGGLLIIFDRGASVSVIPIGDEAGTDYVMIILG